MTNTPTSSGDQPEEVLVLALAIDRATGRTNWTAALAEAGPIYDQLIKFGWALTENEDTDR